MNMRGKPIDLRSDTVTRPTPAMRRVMADAEVGDDVMDGDPTVVRLERRIAEMLGKEAAMFMPSGTMANQVAIRLHCQLGDELLCEEQSHIFNKQQGGFAQLSGVVARTIRGSHGVMDRQILERSIRSDNEHHTRTRLVCLENTHNRAGGTIHPLDELCAVTEWAHTHGLATHLDGARIFNAVVATGIDAPTWCRSFDTVCVCFSKGLGAPVGSALVGPRDMMDLALRHRKVFGGAMRQAGIVAAGALHALEHHVDRLAEDHDNANILASAIRQLPGLSIISPRVETNIVIFSVRGLQCTAAAFVARLREAGVLVGAASIDEIRAVTHLDVTRQDAEFAAAAILRVGESFTVS